MSEAEGAISCWEARCHDLEQNQHSESDDSSTDMLVKLLRSEVLFKHSLFSMPESVLGSVTESLNAKMTSSVIEQLSAELENQNTILKEWCDGLQEQIASLHEEAKTSTEAEVNEDEQKRPDIEELLSSKLEAMRSEHNQEIEAMQARRRIDREHIIQIEQERDELKSKSASLEDELREANDGLQIHVTNEASAKATEMVAQTLRKKVDELRSQQQSIRKACSEERTAREAAERKISQLSDDLAMLLGLEGNNDSHSEIQRRTYEATQAFQRKERAEMEYLKKSLARTQDEAQSLRQAEHDAKERLSKALLQTSMFEKEAVAAKDDVDCLKKTIDEMRVVESSTRASFEYRIISLENEQDVQRRFHTAEIENLRYDLNQSMMERDRLFQLLKEKEKHMEALVQAKSRGEALESEGADVQTEFSKLQVEKQQLLVSATEEAAKFERRLREALAAEKSSFETDILVERELRIAAEKTSEILTSQIEKLKADYELNHNSESLAQRQAVIDMSEQQKVLKKQNKILSTENKDLFQKLEKAEKRNKEAEGKVVDLSEECRIAMSRASKLERDGRYEAEVRIEVAKLQALSKAGNQELSQNPAVDDERQGCEDDMPAAHLYDIIEKQKQAIGEERAMYQDLLEEQDELLAVLAQQDLLKAVFKDALARFGGQSAVDEATQEAQEKSMAQYGNPIRLT